MGAAAAIVVAVVRAAVVVASRAAPAIIVAVSPVLQDAGLGGRVGGRVGEGEDVGCRVLPVLRGEPGSEAGQAIRQGGRA